MQLIYIRKKYINNPPNDSISGAPNHSRFIALCLLRPTAMTMQIRHCLQGHRVTTAWTLGAHCIYVLQVETASTILKLAYAISMFKNRITRVLLCKLPLHNAGTVLPLHYLSILNMAVQTLFFEHMLNPAILVSPHCSHHHSVHTAGSNAQSKLRGMAHAITYAIRLHATWTKWFYFP